MQSGLSKLGMRLWGLGSGKTLIYFIDDMNMPYKDGWGTQSPIALLRQINDYGIVYDRENLEEYNKLQDLYFCTCMNPKSGSFTIELRLQRHFSVFAIPPPNENIIKRIYKSILNCHFETFEDVMHGLGEKIVDGSLALFNKILRDPVFSPSSIKFHYQWNLREISKITEGVMFSLPFTYKTDKFKIFKLWVHECRRVFEDRLICESDIEKFLTHLGECYKIVSDGTSFNDDKNRVEVLDGNSNIFTTFIAIYEGADEKYYNPIKDEEELNTVLAERLAEYNEGKAQMNLVLFQEAAQHICKISRIIDRPSGNALLVGVGGSGKQSLTKLSVFLLGSQLDTIVVTSNFGVNEFKAVVGEMFKKATKPPGMSRVFMISDAQITDDDFLVVINDMVSSGYVPGLWARDELDGHIQTLKNEAKIAGYTDKPEDLMIYFVEKLKKNTHSVLCMSPVGDTLRIRARKFPGLINSTSIDWFHSWPKDALYKVAINFLKDVDFPSDDIREAICLNMAETHILIDETNIKFRRMERRFNYTTPKSFLELIEFYKSLLAEKKGAIEKNIEKLKNGLATLLDVSTKVKELEGQLKIVMVDVEIKTKETNILIEEVNRESAIAAEEQAIANAEEDKVTVLVNKANAIKEDAESKFLAAKPKLEAAEAAVERLDEKQISIFKGFKSPPALCMLTGKVVLFIYKGDKFDLFGEKDNTDAWKKTLALLSNVKRFLADLKKFSSEDAKYLEEHTRNTMNKLFDSGTFEVKRIFECSPAAGN